MARKTLGDAAANRKNHFDILRLLLAAMVVFHHSYTVLYKGRGPAWSRDPMEALTAGRADLGSAAVYGFFIISGFLIAASWDREPRLGRYLRKRVARIYPAFVAMMAFCLLFVGPLATAAGGAYWHGLSLSNILGSAVRLEMPVMPGAFTETPAHAVNVSVWTIAYEFRCYVLVALLGLLGAFRWRASVLALLGLMMAAFLWCTWGGAPVLHGRSIRLIGDLEFWPPLATYFIAGTAAYLYRERIPYSRTWFLLSLAGILGCLLLNLVALLPVFGTYTLLYVALQPRGDTQWARRYGDFSYGLYLYAYPVQQLLRRHFPDAWTPTRLSLVALVISLALAALSWHLVEKWFLKGRRVRPVGGTGTHAAAADAAAPRAEATSPA